MPRFNNMREKREEYYQVDYLMEFQNDMKWMVLSEKELLSLTEAIEYRDSWMSRFKRERLRIIKVTQELIEDV